MTDPALFEWLMDGDPAIRWQFMRDLRDAPASAYQAERSRIANEGWGRRLLDLQGDDGRWTAKRGPKGFRGLYTPKWTSTTYTLLQLRRMGLEPRQPSALRGCAALVDGSQWLADGSIAPWASPKTDTCVCAMVLGILEWFDFDSPNRRSGLLKFLLDSQKNDGGWNCQDGSRVGSFHTTISTLEALQERRANTPSAAIDAAMERGHEYLLQRRLYRSLSSGKIIRPSFKLLSFPPRWYYDVLRALDHLQGAGVAPDDRVSDALEVVQAKRRKDRTWPLQNKHSGEAHFEMEKPGKPSRWNTLRVLRVLRWRTNGPGEPGLLRPTSTPSD